ncbi:MAG TPA: acyl-CoA synthetase [Porticoccaceae bacterium]|jgi:fatty-acyl-CoA synthase|nr:acyl-CoA synthetase [Porticoccaceae bacterium]
MTSSKYNNFSMTMANYEPLSPLSFLHRTAMMFPNRQAVVYGERSYTWSEFYTRCKKLASALRHHGVCKGDTVAVLAANTPEMIEAHFGVPMSGAVLNTINTRLDEETITYILEHGEAKVFIVDAELAPQAQKALTNVKDKSMLVIDILDKQNHPAPARIGLSDYEAFLSGGNDEDHWKMPTNEWDAIALNYTSGTSGRPKGVVYHHRGSYLMSMGTIADWDLPRHPNYLYTVPLFHCNGWGHAWTMTALAGTIFCTRAIVPEDIFTAIKKYNITHLGGAPIVLSMLLNSPAATTFSCSQRIQLMTAGAPPPASVLQGIEKLGFNVTQVYGLTETYGHTVMCTWNEDWNHATEEQRALLKARQGAAMVQTAGMRIVDMDTKDDVPADGKTIGEILLRGNTIMKGYLKDPETTETAFSDGWFHTGDLAVMHPHGYAEIKDRLKDIIISGGENISSVEIEGILHKHEAVSLAAVVALPDDKWGEVPCAFLELLEGAEVSEQEIELFCRAHLAGYKRPKKIIFGELPKTATGKIQKYELRALARSGNVK